jgi:hypothetical protein
MPRISETIEDAINLFSQALQSHAGVDCDGASGQNGTYKNSIGRNGGGSAFAVASAIAPASSNK